MPSVFCPQIARRTEEQTISNENDQKLSKTLSLFIK
jgi:hypothetical protein